MILIALNCDLKNQHFKKSIIFSHKQLVLCYARFVENNFSCFSRCVNQWDKQWYLQQKMKKNIYYIYNLYLKLMCILNLDTITRHIRIIFFMIFIFWIYSLQANWLLLIILEQSGLSTWVRIEFECSICDCDTKVGKGLVRQPVGWCFPKKSSGEI